MAVVSLLALAMGAADAAPSLRLNGMVASAADGMPIEGAVVSFDLNPPDASPELRVTTDPFGFYHAPALPAGSYALTVEHPQFARSQTNFTALEGVTNQVIRLAPVDGRLVFDLFAQVHCLATHAALGDALVTAEHWRIDGTLDGPPDAVFTAPANAAGSARLTLLPEGYYRLRVQRAGWEPLAYVPPPGSGAVLVGDKIRLSKSHYASVFLRPIKTDLKITVRGFDPAANAPDRPLKDMVIRLEGIDLADTNSVVVPVLSALSGLDGSYLFRRRPPVRWRVTVGRFGYVMREILIAPQANGTFADTVIEMELAPTKLKVITDSVYKLADATAGALVRLEGLRDSNTEGIQREVPTVANAADFGATALFENLLPGRYWIRVQHQTTITNFPSSSGPIPMFNSFRVTYLPVETYAEPVLTNTTELPIRLTPVPARIRGRLFASEQQANVQETLAASEQFPIYHALAATGLVFREAKAADLLPEGENAVVVDTDSSGHFTALVNPGMLGVEIPTLASHTGYGAESGAVSEGFGLFVRGWPYAQVWPYPNYDPNRHASPLIMSSDEETQINLYVHRKYVNLCGFILNPFSDPFRSLVLSVPPSGASPVTNSYNHFYDTQAKVQVTGPVSVEAPVLPDGSYVARDLPSGQYTLALAHPEYTTPARAITIAPWNAPGLIPPVSHVDASHWHAGRTHSRLSLNLQPTWNSVGLIRVNRKVYTVPPEGAPFYATMATENPQYFETPALPGRLFTFQPGGIPNPSWVIYYKHGEEWFRGVGSGAATLDAYEGGPLDNTSAGNFPGEFQGYTVDLHAYSRKDRHYELTNALVTFVGGEVRPASAGLVSISGQPQVTAATAAGGRWTLRSSATEVRVVDPLARLVRVNVFLDRSMTITGLVTSAGRAIERVAVTVRNRYGAYEGQSRVFEQGNFNVQFVTPQAFFLEVQARGYLTRRIFLGEPDPLNPDQAIDVELQPVPPPTLTDFTMNRFGLFLPGVTMSGDSTGFDPQNARDRLTMTWSGAGSGQDFTLTLPGFFNEANEQDPDVVSTVEDKIREMYLIDRRAFTNAFINDLNQEAAEQNQAPFPLDYAGVSRWLKDIKVGVKNGRHFHVVHQLRQVEVGGAEWVQGELPLWELPSGAFNPMLLAITEAGGVAVKDYSPVVGGVTNSLLQGLGLSRAAANILDAAGAAANLPSFEKFGFANYGSGLMQIGSLAPVKAEGRIGFIPSNARPQNDAYLTYKYSLGAEMSFGEGSTEQGPMSFGPGFLGLKPKGVTLEFEVDGKAKKVSIAPVFGATTPEDLKKTDRDYKPILAEGESAGNGNKFDVKPEISAKVALAQTLDADWLGRNHISAHSLTVEVQGKVDMEARFNASPVTGKIPYVGPVLLALDKSGALRTFAVIEGTLGYKQAVEVQSTFPLGGVTTTAIDPARFDIIGGTTVQSEIKIFLRLAGGLQLSGFRDSLTGTALFQLGAPATTPDVDGVVFSINPFPGNGHYLTKIEGALSFVLRGELHLWTFRARKQWQWDIGRFVIDRGSEPMFELVNLNITQSVTTPGSVAPQRFIGAATNIVENFFPGGSIAVTAGGNSVLAFTGVDENGRMTIQVSARAGDRWNAPVAVATADAILSLAALALPDGRVLVVWSEIAEQDIGNPFPASVLRFTVSDAPRASWSTPADIAAGPETMFDVKLAQAGAQSLLVFLSAAEGRDGPKTPRHAAFDGASWTVPADLAPPAGIRSLALSAAAPQWGAAGFTTADGEFSAFQWNGAGWAGGAAVATNAGGGLALLQRSNGVAHATWITASNQVQAAAWSPSAQAWNSPFLLASSVFGNECAMVEITRDGEPLVLVAWASGADRNSLFHAVFDPSGAVRLSPTEITVGSAGFYDRLQLRALGGPRAALVAAFTANESTSLREFVVGLPDGADCDGDGIPDDAAIAQGLAADCNHNGIPDLCEIRQGFLPDRNHNGIPDSCEPAIPDDCNRNGVSDTQELSLGIGDQNANGILDDCEQEPLTLTVPIPTDVPQRYYRAPALRIRSRTATTIELEFHGALEQTENLNTPFRPAN